MLVEQTNGIVRLTLIQVQVACAHSFMCAYTRRTHIDTRAVLPLQLM